MIVDVIIPALNEVQVIGSVVRAIPRPPVREVIVVDNGSTDGTARAAEDAGARVVREEKRGYGAACLAGLAALRSDTEVIAFLDGDGSEDPSCLPLLLAPLLEDRADLVVGSRVARASRGALSPAQRLGNAIASQWLRTRFGQPTTDLGPFRVIRREALERLAMRDETYGWTVEMQIKAARAGLRYAEVSVPYRERVGTSKISGTLRGSIGAGVKILGLLALHDLGGPRRR